MNFTRVKIEILIPTEFVAPLRDALADVGAGKIGNYDHCVSISQVTGYWRPLEAATPYAGQVGEICSGQEAKVEVNCHVGRLKSAMQAIRRVHPYEEPVINVIPLLDF